MTLTLLLSRPLAQSERFAEMCRKRLGGDIPIIISPVLRIEALERPDYVHPSTVFIFTSENGVRAFGAVDPNLEHIAYCVGDQTAKVAGGLGFRSISAGGTAHDLVARICADAPQGPLLYLHGAYQSVDIVADLKRHNLTAQAHVIYEQVAQPLSANALAILQQPHPVVLPIFSPRSARLLWKDVQDARAKQIIAALSPSIAKAWNEGPAVADQSVQIAERPDGAHMLETLAAIWKQPMP